MRRRSKPGPFCVSARLVAWVCLSCSALSFLFAADNPEPNLAPKKYTKAVLIRFEGMINPMRERFLFRQLDAAQARQCDLVIVEFDSPGGYLNESLNMAERLRGTGAHTVAFVPREALSGAAIASLGCDEIVMARTARFGDAGPIFMGEDALFRHAPEKLRSDLARRVRDLAEAKGRSPALAEAMIDMDLEVFHVRHLENGQEKYLTQHELAATGEPDKWQKLKPVLEARKGHFLEVNGVRALELGISQGIADNREELRRRYDVAGEFKIVESGWLDTTVYILNLPLVTVLLFVVGLIALYVEFSAPGIGMGGVVAGICFAVFFWSRFLGGTADWLEVVLFVAGGVFLIIEIFVTPGFGIMGITGLLLMFIGAVLACQDFVVPRTGRELNTLATSLAVVLGSGVTFTIAAVGLSHYFGSIPLFNKLVLKPPPADEPEPSPKLDANGNKIAPAQPHGDFGVSVGDWGTSVSLLRPAGKARFGDRYLDVVTDGSFVNQGTQVCVIEISGNRVVVREVEQG